jgi:hypothetical protein
MGIAARWTWRGMRFPMGFVRLGQDGESARPSRKGGRREGVAVGERAMGWRVPLRMIEVRCQ